MNANKTNTGRSRSLAAVRTDSWVVYMALSLVTIGILGVVFAFTVTKAQPQTLRDVQSVERVKTVTQGDDVTRKNATNLELEVSTSRSAGSTSTDKAAEIGVSVNGTPISMPVVPKNARSTTKTVRKQVGGGDVSVSISSSSNTSDEKSSSTSISVQLTSEVSEGGD